MTPPSASVDLLSDRVDEFEVVCLSCGQAHESVEAWVEDDPCQPGHARAQRRRTDGAG